MEFDREPPVVGYPAKSGGVAGRRYSSGSSGFAGPADFAPRRLRLAMSAPIQAIPSVQLVPASNRVRSRTLTLEGGDTGVTAIVELRSGSPPRPRHSWPSASDSDLNQIDRRGYSVDNDPAAKRDSGGQITPGRDLLLGKRFHPART